MSSDFDRLRRRLIPAATVLLDWMLPAVCVACELPLPAGLPSAQQAPRGWCETCANRLPGAGAPRCPGCGERMPAHAGGRCAVCRARPPATDLTIVLGDYARPLDHLIQAIKFGRQSALAAPLGRLMARAATRCWDAPEPPDAVIPIPMSASRLADRGFNQALLLARPVAAAFGLKPVRSVLVRVRQGAPASSLGASQRRDALAHAFEAVNLAPGAKVLLVDDVMTTGATLQAAALALKSAGAGRVVACVAARTPAPIAAQCPSGFAPDEAAISSD